MRDRMTSVAKVESRCIFRLPGKADAGREARERSQRSLGGTDVDILVY